MVDKVEEYRFDSVGELFDCISPWGISPNLDGFIFRGHAQEGYELIPTSLRLKSSDDFWKPCGGKPAADGWKSQSWQIRAEYNLLRSFYRLADQRGLEVPISNRMRSNLAQKFDTNGLVAFDQQDIWIPPDLYEVAALAQHYGVPTRLLDWTYDIYVALYFAFRGAIGKNGYLAVWALNQQDLSFLKPTVSRVNVEFITPHYSGNPNLSAQKGLFTLWPVVNQSLFDEMSFMQQGRVVLVDRRPLNELVFETLTPQGSLPIFKKFIVPCSEAIEGCKILDRLGYNSSSIFPGYGGVAKQVMSQHEYG